MARRNREEEQLLSYSPQKKGSIDYDDWDDEIEDDFLEDEVLETAPAVEQVEAVEEVTPVVSEPVVEEEPVSEEVVVAPIEEEAFEEEEPINDGYDRTHIFDHARVYYDTNTTILPRNFESRLRLSSDELKTLYSQLKNVLMEYSGVKSRMLKYVEVFRCGGAVAKIKIKGKSLYLYLKLNPASIDHDYLKVVDKSHRRAFVETPAEIKVTGKRKCKRSIEMIRLMMDALGVGHRRHPENIDYVAKYPYIENAVIQGKNMIKVPRRSDYVK